MSELVDRYDKVGGRFTRRVNGVADGGWDNPAPCEGRVARDVVRHLMEWIPGFFDANVGLEPMDEMLRTSGHYGPRVRCRTTPTLGPG